LDPDRSCLARKPRYRTTPMDRGPVGENQLDDAGPENDERRDHHGIERARPESKREPDRECADPDEHDRTAGRSHSTRTEDSAARTRSEPVSSVFATGRTRCESVTSASRWMSSGVTYSRPESAARACPARTSDSDPRGLTPSSARSRVWFATRVTYSRTGASTVISLTVSRAPRSCSRVATGSR